MPNWVTNKLTIESDRLYTIQRIKEFFGDLDFNKIIPMPPTLNIADGTVANYAVLFYLYTTYRVRLLEAVSPIPQYIMRYPRIPLDNDNEDTRGYSIAEQLMHLIGKPSDNISYLWDPEYDTIKDGDLKCRGDVYELGKIIFENIKIYNHPSWYRWRLDYWGTKWSANIRDWGNDWYKEFKDQDIYMIQYTFDTAWSMPYGIYNLFLARFGHTKSRINIQWADEDIGYNLGWLKKDYNEFATNLNMMTQVPIGKTQDDLNKYACMIKDYDYKEFCENMTEE